MSDLKQFLDWEGLKHYDGKIKGYIGDRTCSIGEDGYWYIGGVKTEYMATGHDGQDGVDGAPGKDGVDGLTPFVGENGNWWIGTTDTGLQVEGKDGQDGAPGKDGVDGQDGQDGTSVSITSTDKVDGVTTITFSDGNTITINDGVDGQDGEDGDVLNLQLGEEIKTNVACGALTAGQTLEANLTLADIVKKLTTTVYEPSKGDAPKASLAMTNQDTVVEVGTTITPTLTPSFIDGKFKTYGEGATSSTIMNAGCKATGYTISRGETEIASGTTLEAFTDSYPISEESVIYSTTINYDVSTKYPQDSNGDEDTTIIWDGSNVSANSKSITGKYQYYTGCSNVDPTADDIRAALNNTKNWIDPSKTVDIVNTNTKMIFAIPSGYSLVSAISSTKEPQTDNFVKSTITIKDAGGNDVLYNLYIMTNSLVGNFTTTFTYKKGQ